MLNCQPGDNLESTSDEELKVQDSNTSFAFTGDVVAGTGWLDQEYDSRNMITTGPFNIKASESKTKLLL